MSVAAERLTPPTRRQIAALAWPIILANVASPLLGLADTAVIGHVGTVADLGGIALGALVFNFLYWGFGFLRQSTAGFTAQCDGGGDEPAVRAAVARAGLIALGVGLALLVLQAPIGALSLWLLGGTAQVEGIVADYFAIRIWGAPATLGTWVVLGTFVGLSQTRQLLLVQVFLNGLNIALDLLFAQGMGMGVRGIALGTAIAEWSAFLLAAVLALSLLRERRRDAEPFWPWQRIHEPGSWARTFSANRDIMIRTLLMLLAFGWFTNQGALFGDRIVAANHILLQLISFSAFFLDGFANAAEPLVGRALGARRLDVFDVAVRRSTELAGAVSLGLALAILLLGGAFIGLLTDLASVRETAIAYLPWAAGYVLLSFAAFQLDGIFIGATRTRAMRDGAFFSTAAFFVGWWVLTPRYQNVGLWAAFVLYVVARAIALGVQLPSLRRAVARG